MGNNAFDFPLPLPTWPPNDEALAVPADLGEGEALFSITYEIEFFADSQEEADMIAQGLGRGIFQLADVDCITGPNTATQIEDYRA